MATTTLSRMAKKVASSSVNQLLAYRRTPHRNYTSAIFTTPLKTISNTGNSTTNLFRTTLVPTHHHFSAQAQKISIPLESLFEEIKSDFEEFSKTPRDFPFKIEDREWKKNIFLTREYQDEKIKIEVEGPLSNKDYYPNDHVYLTVIVSNSKNNEPTLELGVIATPDNKILFRYLEVKKPYAGCLTSKVLSPNFKDLDEKLHKPFLKYLKDRGIEPSIGKVLNYYMDNRKYVGWFNKLKKFIET